jgi:uncharacterized protein YjbJ (UPF0337 family)
MNKDIIKGKWKEMSGKVKQQWGKLTDDNVTKINGSYEELQGTLQKQYGYGKEEADKEINAFIDKNGWNDKSDNLRDKE